MMSEDKVSVIAKTEVKDGDVRFTEERGWIEYNSEYGWLGIPMVDVPVDELLMKWEDLVNELSDKEVELYRLKEAYLIAESEIVNNTDFKALYGKNNEKVRTNHVKSELADMVSDMEALEFGINWIRGYIPLLRECIRVKHDSTPHINSPTPIVLDSSPMTDDVVFKDCEYRYLDGELVRCANMKEPNDDLCDNCKGECKE